MRHYALLLKKQFFDALPFSSKRGGSKGLFSVILTWTLVIGIVAAFALIFSKFTETYLQIKINRVPDVAARQYEIMSIAYFALIVIFTVSGTLKLCYTIFENSDINVLISLPFSSIEIFAAKLSWVYIGQAIASLICVLGVNITFFVTAGIVNAYGVLMSFVVALVLPVLPLAIASILALPFYYLKRAINSHYLLSFAVMTLVLAAFCVLYAEVFNVAEALLGSGKLASLFNERTMLAIADFAAHDYPANLFANVMLGIDVGKSIGILIAVLVVSAAIGILVIRAIFVRVTQSGLSASVPHVERNKIGFSKKSRLGSLLYKEFITVIRTPSYAYMYFATAIIMPLMSYYSAKLGTSVLSSLLGGVRFDFELCTFIVILYGTLTNTFCSTNISRDGYMSMAQKTLPYSPEQILSSKMLFSGIVAEASILAACITLAATGLESAGDAVVTFIAATLLAAAQIAFATRLDLNHPHFSRTDDGEIKEASSTVSVIILTGLAVCFLIGLLLLFNTVSGLIGGAAAETDKRISYAYAICLPAALLGASAAFFFVNLKKVYLNLDAEE